MGLIAMLRAEGRHEGLLAGRMAGMQEGRQEMLARLLRRRFGPLDTDTESRLKSASIDELNQWIDNILDARSIDEVFGNVSSDETRGSA